MKGPRLVSPAFEARIVARARRRQRLESLFVGGVIATFFAVASVVLFLLAGSLLLGAMRWWQG